MIQNKAPGKDVSASDMEEKFPLASKKNDTHFFYCAILYLRGYKCIADEFF